MAGQMSNRRQNIGRWGEEVAAKYLAAHGYTILSRNMRTPHGEIDIIACREQVLVFVEVKSRTTSNFGHPEIAVTARKQAHMLASAEQFIQESPEEYFTWQFDVIAIEGKPGSEPKITHFENILA